MTIQIEACEQCGAVCPAGWCGHCHKPTQGLPRLIHLEQLAQRLRDMAEEQNTRQQKVYGAADIRDAIEREDVLLSAATAIMRLNQLEQSLQNGKKGGRPPKKDKENK